ncbi:MAG: hypothetical protein FJ290_03365 [Planctomycetes bacterium]|nr:hypothetical protein [Planctomycetota bacterium]
MDANSEGTPTPGPQAEKRAGPQTLRAARSYTSDLATPEDALGFEPYVDAMAGFLLDENTRAPLTLSIEGEWGSGKSSFMLQLGRRLRHAGMPVVEFSAWRHDKEESLWAAFALTFVEQLAKTKTRWQRSRCAWDLFKIRFDWLRGLPAVVRFVLPLLVDAGVKSSNINYPQEEGSGASHMSWLLTLRDPGGRMRLWTGYPHSRPRAGATRGVRSAPAP